MLILGIETSCDETSTCLLRVKNNKMVLVGHVVVSQANLHKKYGGVVPELAAREHLQTIIPALKEAGFAPNSKIDAIAVTVGPGLITSLMVGVEVAKTLAWSLKKSLIKVNHIEGHIYSPFLELPLKFSFPYLALVVSGGHTELILMSGHGKYKLIGRTQDDAAGEAFDKVAKLLGLPYPGGPVISKLAKLGDSSAFDFPRPMIDDPSFNFSFSGLKTAVIYQAEKIKTITPKIREDICASFEKACVDVLIHKTFKAAKKYNVKSVILAGGVSANLKLREEFSSRAKKEKLKLLISPLVYTGDNAAMIALAGYFHAVKKDFVSPFSLEADASWELV